MSDDNKISKAQQKAVNKYVKNNYDRINVTFPKGQKEKLKEHAQNHNESVNAFIVRSVLETMERDNQSSGLSQKATPSEPAIGHPEPGIQKSAILPRPSAPDHGHSEAKTESSAPSCESPAEKLEQLRRKTMEAMAAQRNNPEYGSGDNSHIRIKQAEEPDTYRETFEEKMARLSKSHPLKTDGVVQRQ